MPFYEYECSACKFYVEALQKISEPPLRKCPSCKKQSLKRLVSAPVFRLKGAGWYETDFKSDKEDKRNLAGREEPAESKADGKDAKTETKEAAKPEAKATETKADKPEPKKTVVSKPAAKASARPPAKAAKRPPAKAAAKKKAARR